MSKRVLLGGWALLVAFALPAMAGRNSGGAILLHTNDAYTYSSGTRCTTELARPANCAGVITRTDKDSRPVIWALAMFDPTATPRVATIYFGLMMDVTCIDPAEFNWTWCSDDPVGNPPSQDVSAGWPGHMESATVGWPNAITMNPFPFLAIRVEEELCAAPGAYISTSVNHVGGYAAFIDDSNPPITDETAKFGTVRWYEDGSKDCPVAPLRGACCMPDATCQLVFSFDCPTGAIYQGDGTTCDSPCGACCFWLTDTVRRCVVTTQADCGAVTRWDGTAGWNSIKVNVGGNDVGADWSYAGSQCAEDASQADTRWWCQNPQESNPTQPTSWGKLKGLYR